MYDQIKLGIIEELKKGDRFACELKDALRIQKYLELWAAIKSLKDEGKIEHYFAPTPPSATLTYKLSDSYRALHKPNSILSWGKKQ